VTRPLQLVRHGKTVVKIFCKKKYPALNTPRKNNIQKVEKFRITASVLGEDTYSMEQSPS
jgi:hypothetical protein